MFIGIDLGTSSVKMIIVDYDQNILATADSPVSVQNPKDGYSEQNPEEWINATLECLEVLKSKKPKEFIETIAIGISGQMHGATLIDSSGEVIRLSVLQYSFLRRQIDDAINEKQEVFSFSEYEYE